MSILNALVYFTISTLDSIVTIWENFSYTCTLNKNLKKKMKEYVINAVFTICRQEKLALDSSMRAPFPPVCFTINAKPPAGYLYYFAYGPNMNPNRY